MELREVSLHNNLSLNDLTQITPIEMEGEEGFLVENHWGFPYFAWEAIQEELETVDRLYDAIVDKRQKIAQIKEKFRFDAVVLDDFEMIVNTDAGISGSYILVDRESGQKYLIKPLDEDGGCVHSMIYSTLDENSPFRKNMPLYASSLREVLAYEVAEKIGLHGIVPKTELAIIESPYFHDLSENVSSCERERYEQICGEPDREKLTSMQEYITGAKTLFEAVQDLQSLGLSDEEIRARFDSTDFEEANILLWVTCDTDGHGGNFLVYPKGVDAIGNEILGIKKIDNGLSFPEKNGGLRNHLVFLPPASNVLSDEAIAKVLAIDVEALALSFEKRGLEGATAALKERIEILKNLVSGEKLTISEINSKISRLERKDETDHTVSS